MDGRSILSPTDTTDDLEGTAFRHAQNHLVGAFATADFRSAVRLLDAVAVVADELNHHPDVRLGWGRVEFALTSHDVGGVTPRDVELALRIGEIADQLGATAE
ncbi:4a-hydroxytetrahydrobiopterin dehydratase [Agromyces sp. ISL-38]|uniref:4a-hydroxytetrahydrobiopterin dehydratase n=1 Tax=Agromyces sp. ISL-38 TaxID=2819107 RepID=UPI001BEC4A97|nr:4a-hydroxytetrahydrobiopterin dehydratase [Agromyces sp. ISL-38]MBT2500496.1 4a-hydroxytetrahydrobiopterin dehydratase [Agromyces sp. ISL-38]MBT2519238.1 4a-hydroxytetrahydrobiopterin dehydratase [Streptomyces sp. ISL-90]